ncbi:MAG: GAD domain-containing protein, partial [Candidatus Woesearchaeota archaeon]
LWIENEILRQQNILLIKEKVPKKEIEEKIFDVTSIFSNSQSNVIKKAFEKNGKVYAVKLPGFLGLTGFEIQPGRRVGTEISDYAKVYGGVGGLFHTDELPKYGITQDDVNKIKEKLECDNNSKDAFILVADEENKCKRALKAVVLRANLFKNGVLEEVRKPNDDGTSSFMRPIPGRNRMYPETDCIPVRISYDNVKLPELISQKIERYVKDYNLGKDLATSIVKEIPKFEEIVSDYKNLKPAYVAETLIGVNKLINKKYDINIEISEDSILEVLSYLEKGQITTDAVIEILKENKPISQIISNYELMDNETLEKKIVAILHENKDKPKNALTGIVMGQLRTKASPQKIIELVKKHNV